MLGLVITSQVKTGKKTQEAPVLLRQEEAGREVFRASLTSMLRLLVPREQVLGADLLAAKADLLLQFLDLSIAVFPLLFLLFQTLAHHVALH